MQEESVGFMVNHRYFVPNYDPYVDITFLEYHEGEWGTWEVTQIQVYTSDAAGDTDGDLIPDPVEVELGADFNPADPTDGYEDHDMDGLPTGEEIAVHGTHWDLANSDLDPYSFDDGFEVLVLFSNPLDPNDPLDGEEVANSNEGDQAGAGGGSNSGSSSGAGGSVDGDGDGSGDGSQSGSGGTGQNAGTEPVDEVPQTGGEPEPLAYNELKIQFAAGDNQPWALDYTRIDLEWAEVAGADQYRIFRRQNWDPWPDAPANTVTELKHTDTPPHVGALYLYRVEAWSIDEDGAEQLLASLINHIHVPVGVASKASGQELGGEPEVPYDGFGTDDPLQDPDGDGLAEGGSEGDPTYYNPFVGNWQTGMQSLIYGDGTQNGSPADPSSITHYLRVNEGKADYKLNGLPLFPQQVAVLTTPNGDNTYGASSGTEYESEQSPVEILTLSQQGQYPPELKQTVDIQVLAPRLAAVARDGDDSAPSGGAVVRKTAFLGVDLFHTNYPDMTDTPGGDSPLRGELAWDSGSYAVFAYRTREEAALRQGGVPIQAGVPDNLAVTRSYDQSQRRPWLEVVQLGDTVPGGPVMLTQLVELAQNQVAGDSAQAGPPPVMIREITFSGWKYEELKSDDLKTTYSGPHWKDSNGNQKVRGTVSEEGIVQQAEEGDRNYPVAFSGVYSWEGKEYLSQIEVTLRLDIPKDLAGDGTQLKLKGRTIGKPRARTKSTDPGLDKEDDAVQFDVIGDLHQLEEGNSNSTHIPFLFAEKEGEEYKPIRSSATLAPRTVQHYHNADNGDPFVIEWELSADGGTTWTPVHSTNHTLYVTRKQALEFLIHPYHPDHPEPASARYESVFHRSTEAAHSISNIDTIFEKVWDVFSLPAPDTANQIFAANGEGPFVYWGDGEAETQKTAADERNGFIDGLIEQRRGRCNSFSQFFQAMTRIHGDDSVELVKIDPAYSNSPNQQDIARQVAIWYYQHPTTPWDLTQNFPTVELLINKWDIELPHDLNPGTNNGDPGSAVRKGSIAAQGATAPFAQTFTEHIIVRRNEVFFDPSYGIGNLSTVNEWEEAAYAGSSLMIVGVDPSGKEKSFRVPIDVDDPAAQNTKATVIATGAVIPVPQPDQSDENQN